MPPLAGWPESVIVRLVVMEEDDVTVVVGLALEVTEASRVAETEALAQRVRVRDAVGLKDTSGLRDADEEMEGLLTVGSMVLESVG